ncbi:pilus assembly protein [Sedimentimonas flavescens]|uniref:Pilus assembly protein n=1 Tax=Sedimentimonas flavescens TaxID=2851012 RepID=A0ABT2ZW77_9RHOB|nr:TadE/TadG family type IV pilus assembly protein [Sedimentimonas flavescens]MCV2878013.1 pilus assembly protein [Sedimentimonas flavescens]
MGMWKTSLNRLKALYREEEGAQLVEFAIVLPLMLVIFAIIIEGARMMWSFQAVSSGVRDGVRYLGRAVAYDVCEATGESGFATLMAAGSPSLNDTVYNIVALKEGNAVLFPTSITINSVGASLTCEDDIDFHGPELGLVNLTASISITYPFASIFKLIGNAPATLNTSVSDQTRIYGS